jgi:hypothetical protein
LSLFHGVGTEAASAFASPAFRQQWQQGEAVSTNFWGPLATAHDGQQEPYKDAPGGTRLVQYFDKGRMELTGASVTNGLLATELVTGRMQTGDTTFESRPPPAIPIAGDPDNPGPTYAALASNAKALFDATPARTGNATQSARRARPAPRSSPRMMQRPNTTCRRHSRTIASGRGCRRSAMRSPNRSSRR